MLQTLLSKPGLLASSTARAILKSSPRKCLFNATTTVNREFVSFTASSSQTRRVLEDSTTSSGREIDLLELKDTRFRLPGNVGVVINDNFGSQMERLGKKKSKKVMKKPPTKALNSEELLKELTVQKPIPNIDMFLADDRQILQCDAHECPALMIQDFQELFPNNQELRQGITVMTISQKSLHDMSSWSSTVIDERESLMEKFVFTAERMCNYLKSLGYWADFIDPSSGRPYNGDYTPATFFETDERYRKFGFEIEDLGCCKVISHSRWGTKAFVGALFTNAPVESDAVQSLIIYMDE